jgi:hypothetical protein
MNGNNESSNKKERAASSSPTDPLLKIIEDMLHNKILHKKQEIHKTKTTQSITDT